MMRSFVHNIKIPLDSFDEDANVEMVYRLPFFTSICEVDILNRN